MKVAFIGAKAWPGYSGGDKVIDAIARRMAARGEHDVTVYCARRYSSARLRIDDGVRIVRLPVLPGKYTEAASLFFLASLHALVRGGYSLVHVHHVEACFVLPLLRLRFKVVATSHGPAHRRGKWNSLARVMIRLMEYPYAYLSHAATAVSARQASYYETTYGRTVQAIPNGVDVPGEAATSLRSHPARPPSPYIAFAAQRIIPSKGCALLLRAFRELNDSAVTLLVVGDLSEYPHRAKTLRRLATDRVYFHDPVDSQASLRALLGGATFFVLPSSVEGMSMMLLEVASWGIPIVSSDIPENLAVLDQCAMFFRSGDADHLRTIMRSALDNREKINGLAQKAKQRMRSAHDWDRITCQYAALYASVAQDRK